ARRRTAGGAAVPADAEHVDDVAGVREAVLGRDLLRPALDGFRLDLHRRTAPLADQVVMVLARGARAVQRFPLAGLQGIGLTVAGEIRERPVYGGEADGRAGFA